jgi:2-polyprenyl-3-methyl-5-hydroxy-6-metoxy-1,4-benzoquinol methylase
VPTYELSPCPICASRSAHEVADADEVTREVEGLWAFHMRRLQPETPPARLADRVAFSQHPPIRVVQCDECGLVYRNPRERARELRELYADETQDDAVLASLFENQRIAYRAQAERLTREAGRPGTGLEVGSYVGAFLTAAREQGWCFEGLDINERATAFAQARGCTVTLGDLQSVDGTRRFDAVAIWNCFDQLPDPRGAALAVRALLEPGGLLAVRVPNGAFYLAVRKQLHSSLAPVARALLAHNNLLTFPYRHGFTPDALTVLLERAGFHVQRVVGDVLVPVADEWTRRWAAWEERAIKGALRTMARAGRAGARVAPWIEVYARAAAGDAQN